MIYKFILKDNNQKSYSFFLWFLFFLHIAAAALMAVKTIHHNIRLSMFILLGFYALISSVYFFYKKHKRAEETLNLILALLYTNFWIMYVGVFAVIIFVAIFLFISIVQRKKTNIIFSEVGVEVTNIFKKNSYTWIEMDNVILKDNLLTADFKSNKVIQAEIIEMTESVDEKIFNLFCYKQLLHQD